MCNDGSAVETMKAFECAILADGKNAFQKTYDAYTETKKKIAGM